MLLLHRRGPHAEHVAVLREGRLPKVERASPAEREVVVRLIEAQEGPASAALARAWLRQQPAGLYCARSEEGVLAFALHLYVSPDDRLIAADPVVRAVVEAVTERCALRSGERIKISRFSGGSERYQRHPLVLLVSGVSNLLEYTIQGAAWEVVTISEDELWGPVFEFHGLEWLFQRRHDDRNIVGYGWDRRRFPPSAFLELMARRQITVETGPPPAAMLRPSPLSRSSFAHAVRGSMAKLGRPEGLVDSPLLGSALVDPASPDPVKEVRHLLISTITALGTEPKGAGHQALLERTYLKGALSQESAAEMLGLPLSTYRRHLTKALDRLTEILWAYEIGTLPRPHRGQADTTLSGPLPTRAE